MNEIISGEVLFNVLDAAVAASSAAIANSAVYSLTRHSTAETNKTIRIETDSVLALHNTGDPKCDNQNIFYATQCFVRTGGDGETYEHEALKTAVDMALEIKDTINNNPNLMFNGSPQVHHCTTFQPGLEFNIVFAVVDRGGKTYGAATLYGVINPT
jgi:hypothetical protein